MRALLICCLASLIGCKSNSEVKHILINDPALERVENDFLFDGDLFTGVILASSDAHRNELLIEVNQGLMDGAYKEWTPKYILKTEKQYRKGLEHGVQKGYHSNGKISYEYQAENGKRLGIYREYFRNGKLQIQRTYDKGKEIKVKIFSTEGKIIANYELRNGRYYGLMGSSQCVTVLNTQEIKLGK